MVWYKLSMDTTQHNGANEMKQATSTLFEVTTLTESEARYVANHFRAVAMIHEGSLGAYAAQVAEAAEAAAEMENAWASRIDPGAAGLTTEGEQAMARWNAARIRCERASRNADHMRRYL